MTNAYDIYDVNCGVDIEYDTTGLDDTTPLAADIIVDFPNNPAQQKDNR